MQPPKRAPGLFLLAAQCEVCFASMRCSVFVCDVFFLGAPPRPQRMHGMEFGAPIPFCVPFVGSRGESMETGCHWSAMYCVLRVAQKQVIAFFLFKVCPFSLRAEWLTQINKRCVGKAYPGLSKWLAQPWCKRSSIVQNALSFGQRSGALFLRFEPSWMLRLSAGASWMLAVSFLSSWGFALGGCLHAD